RITCSGAVSTGTFQTKNIPLGMTYSDLPQVDNNHPGLNVIPTLPADRTRSVVDPQTGALIQRVTLPSDGMINPFLQDDGLIRQCSAFLVGPGPGFLCIFDGQRSSAGLYYIIPSTGEVRFLGLMNYQADSGEQLKKGSVNGPNADQGSAGVFYTL